MRPFALLVTLATLTACSTGGTTDPMPDLLPVTADLRDAPATATVDARAVRIEAYAWRDFMPGPDTPRDGQPLIVSARVMAGDGGVLPAGLVPETVWVVRGDRAWRAAATEVRPSPDARSIEVVVRDGPKWGPDAVVDVVVAFRDGAGTRRVVRAAGVTIVRTS
jgi:hypothetical protein